MLASVIGRRISPLLILLAMLPGGCAHEPVPTSSSASESAQLIAAASTASSAGSDDQPMWPSTWGRQPRAKTIFGLSLLGLTVALALVLIPAIAFATLLGKMH